MNRFKQDSSYAGKPALWLPLAAFLLVLLLFLSGIRHLSESSLAGQKESLESALSRSISQCYAVEGAYPPDIAYLQEHYGLTYDSSLFLIDYISYGSNLRPEVTVLQKKQK